MSHFVFSSVERGGEIDDKDAILDRLVKIHIENHVKSLGEKGLKWTQVDSCLFKLLDTGCDVSHPPPNVDTRPSIASVVASVDNRACYYAARIRVQPPHVEMIEELEDMIWVRLLRSCYNCQT